MGWWRKRLRASPSQSSRRGSSSPPTPSLPCASSLTDTSRSPTPRSASAVTRWRASSTKFPTKSEKAKQDSDDHADDYDEQPKIQPGSIFLLQQTSKFQGK